MAWVKPGMRPMTNERKTVGRHLPGERTQLHTCGTKNDSTNDLCDDPGLPDLAQREGEELCHADNDHWKRRKLMSGPRCERRGSKHAHSWMIHNRIGFVGRYVVGLSPDRTPP